MVPVVDWEDTRRGGMNGREVEVSPKGYKFRELKGILDDDSDGKGTWGAEGGEDLVLRRLDMY